MFYGMMRAVLLPRSDPDLLIGRTEDGRALTREEWLRLKFSADIVFLHRAQEYHFVPITDPTPLAPLFIMSRIGRRRLLVENAPPESGFEEVIHPSCVASTISFDDGQKLAFEVNKAVGAPLAIARSLANHINTSAREPFFIELNPTVDPQSCAIRLTIRTYKTLAIANAHEVFEAHIVVRKALLKSLRVVGFVLMSFI